MRAHRAYRNSQTRQIEDGQWGQTRILKSNDERVVGQVTGDRAGEDARFDKEGVLQQLAVWSR